MGNTWKDHERAMARRFSGKRTGNLGKAAPDVTNGWLSIECKSRQTVPQWLRDACDQARVNALPGTLGLAIIHQVGARRDGDLVVMALADFEAWFADSADVKAIAKTRARQG